MHSNAKNDSPRPVKPPVGAPVERHIARDVRTSGPDGEIVSHGLCIIEISRDSDGRVSRWSLLPANRELPFTIWHDGALLLLHGQLLSLP